MILRLLLSAFIFAASGAVGVALAQLLAGGAETAEDDSAAGHLRPAIPAVFMAAVGAVLALRGAHAQQLALVALMGIPLIGSWYADARKGRIPDAFTLLPLAIVIVFAALTHGWKIILFAAITFAAFACAAWLSRGRGMGWGDAKLAGLAGAILGLPWSFGVLGAACLAATAGSIIRDRGKTPIAFAPYMAICVFSFAGFHATDVALTFSWWSKV